MTRTAFLIDGFNLYFSVRQASRDLKGTQTKWLDIRAMCESYLHLIGQQVGDKAQLESIYYFSAMSSHLQRTKPGIIQRQRDYFSCLEDTGIQLELGKFKRKYVRCKHCGQTSEHYEEKETDVAIGSRLIEILVSDKCDTAVLVTGDTDLAAAVRVAQKLSPDKTIIFAFPYKRKNLELEKLAPSFTIGRKIYSSHQFPDPYLLPGGRKINKPEKW